MTTHHLPDRWGVDVPSVLGDPFYRRQVRRACAIIALVMVPAFTALVAIALTSAP